MLSTRHLVLACLLVVTAVCAGCSNSAKPQESRLKLAVLHAGDYVSVDAAGEKAYNFDEVRVPAGKRQIRISCIVAASANYDRKLTWTRSDELKPGQVYRFVVDRGDLYIVLPLLGEAYRVQTMSFPPATQPEGMGVGYATRDLRLDPKDEDKSRSKELAEAMEPMVAEIQNCELSPEDKGLDAEASVLLKSCPGAVFLLEALLVTGAGEPVIGSSGPMAVSREIGTDDQEDHADYSVTIPWAKIDEALKTNKDVYAKLTLTDSLGRLRSAGHPQKVFSRSAR